jgi:hypothetical protein
MKRIKEKLKKQARKLYGEIIPAGNCKDFEECFTFHEDKILFWFNLKDQSTKLISHKIR